MIITCPCGAEFERLETESHLHDAQHRELCLPCAKVEAKKPRRSTMAKAKSSEAKSKPTKKRPKDPKRTDVERATDKVRETARDMGADRVTFRSGNESVTLDVAGGAQPNGAVEDGTAA